MEDLSLYFSYLVYFKIYESVRFGPFPLGLVCPFKDSAVQTLIEVSLYLLFGLFFETCLSEIGSFVPLATNRRVNLFSTYF